MGCFPLVMRLSAPFPINTPPYSKNDPCINRTSATGLDRRHPRILKRGGFDWLKISKFIEIKPVFDCFMITAAMLQVVTVLTKIFQIVEVKRHIRILNVIWC